MRRMFPWLLAMLGSPAVGLDTAIGPVNVVPVVTGLEQPWAVEVLPGGGALVTERAGRLLYLREDTVTPVRGVPAVFAEGQGGLLDITLPRDFEQTREVFLTFAKRQGGGAGTALAVGTLSADGTALSDVRVIFESTPKSRGGRHFGSRVVEAADGTLFVTMGDRGEPGSAQKLETHNGTVVRINRDGSVPADNPFRRTSGAQPEIWSYGHRNPQGADLDANGRLWTAEHGAAGGDEVNLVDGGKNYGWPVISYGVNYNGTKIGDGTAKTGMEQPAFYWDPSIAPSGLLAYDGQMFPEWNGDLFVGSLKFNYISRLETSGTSAREVEQIESDATLRVRDIVQAPDGAIWFISVGQGAVYRIYR